LINCCWNYCYTRGIESKIKEDAESQFAQQADQNGDVTEFLISTKFDLPAEFLKNGCKLLVRKIIS
jgi:trigger factor